MYRVLVSLACLVWLTSAARGQELRLGSVRLKPGTPEGPVVTELRHGFTVRAIEGGWEVRSASDQRAPLVGIRTNGGLIRGVSFVWGPGLTPSLEYVAEQLSYALPKDTSCRVENVANPSEGGMVRTLKFQCGKVRVRSQTGVWTQGNTAALAVELEE